MWTYQGTEEEGGHNQGEKLLVTEIAESRDWKRTT